MSSDASEAAAFARLKHFFNRCKPDEPVPASDEHHFYVDFDALQLRGERCVDTLASTIALDDNPTCQLFTVPVRLVFSSAGPVLGQLYDGEPQVLPMVKVRDRASGAPLTQGHQALRQLLARRVDFEEVFGGNEALVARLVENSGGYIRDLLRLTQYSLQGAGSLPVREEHVSQAIAKLRRSYVRAYSTNFDDLLRYIHEHRPELVPAPLNARLEDVVVTHLTMVYGNEKDWYDVHPLIRDLVQR